MNEDEAVQTSDPVLEVPSDDDILFGPETADPPVEVIPVDEFFDRLSEYFDQQDSSPEDSEDVVVVPSDYDILTGPETEEMAEAPSDEMEEISETDQAASDIPVSDPDPVIGLVDYLIDMIVDLGKIEEQLSSIHGDMETVVQTVDHPALTTPFEEYTVSEALMLLLLLCAFVSACARMLRGGFSWLRS